MSESKAAFVERLKLAAATIDAHVILEHAQTADGWEGSGDLYEVRQVHFFAVAVVIDDKGYCILGVGNDSSETFTTDVERAHGGTGLVAMQDNIPKTSIACASCSKPSNILMVRDGKNLCLDCSEALDREQKKAARQKKKGTLLVQGVPMPRSAALNAEECGVDVALDVEILRTGRQTPAELLVDCLDGADDDRVAGWVAYVDAVSSEASKGTKA